VHFVSSWIFINNKARLRPFDPSTLRELHLNFE